MPSMATWFEVAAYPSPKGLSIYFKNINEKIEQDKKLRQAMERYEILSKATKDAIWDLNIKEGRVSRSYGIKEIFGYADNTVFEAPDWWAGNLHPDDRERVVNKIEYHLNNNITHWEDEYRFRCADGSYKFVYDRGFIMIDEDNKPYRMIGAMMDMTTLKQLENKLIKERVKHQKMLAKASLDGQEKEKNEIGKELHDNINQILATVKLYIESVISTLGGENELLNKSLQHLQLCIEEIRKLSKSLVAPGIKEIGIVDSIKDLIETISLTKLFKIDFDYNGFGVNDLSIQQQLAIYRIVQEQLNNIIKYAHASNVYIKLSGDENEVCLEICDNGKGFDLATKRAGIGLMNIQSRAGLLNGSVVINSSEGAGCTIMVHLPVEIKDSVDEIQ